jgi:Flp pilus assembly protein TadG
MRAHGLGFPRPGPHRLPGLTGDAGGQALVEFVAVLLPLLLVLVGIIQFGLLFNTNVTITNAAREGARAGTIYVYDRQHDRSWNDAQRCTAVLTAVRNAFGILSTTSPNFSVTTSGGVCSNSTGETQTNGDLVISYCASMSTPDAPCPDPYDSTSTCSADTRAGCLLRVQLTYRQDIIVPFIGALLSTDSNGRFVQTVRATMVIN